MSASEPSQPTGLAYQAVAQSAAIAVQDAADQLRNMSAIATTAAGVAMAQYLETGEPRYLDAIGRAQGMIDQAVENFTKVGAAAAQLLAGFPTGE